MKKECKPTGRGNSVLNLEDCLISYNPNTGGLISFFEADNGGDETALIFKEKYYILNGDFREEYSKFNNFKECKKFFDKNLDKISSWSN